MCASHFPGMVPIYRKQESVAGLCWVMCLHNDIIANSTVGNDCGESLWGIGKIIVSSE